MKRKPDFLVSDHGSIVLLEPRKPYAWQWIYDHIGEEPTMFGNAVAIERRYFADIYHGIIDDGLTVA